MPTSRCFPMQTFLAKPTMTNEKLVAKTHRQSDDVEFLQEAAAAAAMR